MVAVKKRIRVAVMSMGVKTATEKGRKGERVMKLSLEIEM